MKLRKTFIIALVVTVLSLSMLLSGCKIEPDGPVPDPTKTQLYIGVQEGGVGAAWVDKLAREFEKIHTDVQVWVDQKGTEYSGEPLFTNMSTSREDVYFTTEVDYHAAIVRGLVADITDIVTEKFDEVDGVKESIEEKLEPDVANYFKRNGKYYALPYYTAINGLIYDVDLFEEYNFYNLQGYSSTNGPDGIADTFDDGLPATYEDMKILMSIMKESGVAPISWSGNQHYYRLGLLRAIWASYEGLNDFSLNYTFDGVDSQFGEIDFENGYKLQGQDGKKAAIELAWDVIKGGYVNRDDLSSIYNHTQTQDNFLLSRSDGSGMNPIAMLCESSWWENEARSMFDDMVADLNDSKWGYGERRFAYMPIPRFVGTSGIPDQLNTKTTLYSDGKTVCFINASSRKLDIAKQFLQYVTSNAALAHFTRTTGIVRPYNYQMSNDDLKAMTPFGRNLWEMYHHENSELVTSYMTSKLRDENRQFFGEKWEYTVTVNSKTYVEPFFPFNNSQTNNLTKAKYIQGFLDNYTQAAWDKQFKKYYKS